MSELKIVFAPGSFDDFEGTQEELDALIEDITKEIRKAEADGTLFEGDMIDLEEFEEMFEDDERIHVNPQKRVLH